MPDYLKFTTHEEAYHYVLNNRKVYFINLDTHEIIEETYPDQHPMLDPENIIPQEFIIRDNTLVVRNPYEGNYGFKFINERHD